MIAAVCLAGVYAGEKGYRTDSVVLSTREGKRSLWLVKFIAGEIFALAAGTLLLIAGWYRIYYSTDCMGLTRVAA